MIGFAILVFCFFIGVAILVVIFRSSVFLLNVKFGQYQFLANGPCINGIRYQYQECIPSDKGNGCITPNGNQSFDIISTSQKCSSPTPAPTNNKVSGVGVTPIEIFTSRNIPIRENSFSIENNSETLISNANSMVDYPLLQFSKLNSERSGCIFHKNCALPGEKGKKLMSRENGSYEKIKNGDKTIIIGSASPNWEKMNLIDGRTIEKVKNKLFTVGGKIFHGNDVNDIIHKEIFFFVDCDIEECPIPKNCEINTTPIFSSDCDTNSNFSRGNITVDNCDKVCIKINDTRLFSIQNEKGEWLVKFGKKYKFLSKGKKETFYVGKKDSQIVLFSPDEKKFFDVDALSILEESKYYNFEENKGSVGINVTSNSGNFLLNEVY